MKSLLAIDTPKNCDECDLCCSFDSGNHWVCVPASSVVKNTQVIDEVCPLHELPKKHICNEYDFEHYSNGYGKGFNDAIDMITGEYNNFKQKIKEVNDEGCNG